MKGSAAKSAQRTFAILELFRRARRPLRLKDVAGALGLPGSSAAELLKAAADNGYLSFDPRSRTYMPVARLAALGDWIMNELYDNGALIERMREVHSIAGDGVILTMVNGLHVEFVEVLPPHDMVHYEVIAGTRRPLVHSGPGWASLCNESDDFIEKLYRRSCAARIVDRRQISLEAVRKGVSSTRSNCFALTHDIVFRDTVGLSVALPMRPHGRRLAMLVNGPTGKLERNFDQLVRTLTSMGSCG